ncbi:DMT family transporter [Stygiolobus caldivivus]|uniref:EamA family transporter n=1 Tax=Stygiolobus caldivivus TaxID=2824673 RepID=A0A8D5ZIH6_9CREN|nr:DMT family transporter [Stygiolobus caldivivus]BCU69302.1 EamA family transporter [Stygiolobus caldivivus]
MKRVVPILTVILVWSSAYPLIKIALEYVSPIVLAIIRLLVGGIILAIYGKGIIYGKKELIGGLINVGAFMLFLNFGVMYSENPALSATLIYTQPIFLILLSAIFLRRRASVLQILGTIIAISGAIYSAGITGFGLGSIISIIGGLVWAIGTLYYQVFLYSRDIVKLNSFMALISSIFLLPFTPFNYYFKLSLIGISVAVLIGVTAQAVGFIAWFSSIKTLGPFLSSSLSLLVPALSYVFSYVILGIVPTIQQLLGSAIVLAGIFLTIMAGKVRKPTG